MPITRPAAGGELSTGRHAHGPDDPVVIVQHGMLRNGDDYRDFWIPAAEKHNILIVAPTFPMSISQGRRL
jgi:hypothetical protein